MSDHLEPLLGKIITGVLELHRNASKELYLVFSDNTHLKLDLRGDLPIKALEEGSISFIRGFADGPEICFERSLPPPLPVTAEIAARLPQPKPKKHPARVVPENCLLDSERIQRLLERQFEAYCLNFRSNGDITQDERAWSILLFAVLLPEVFPRKLQNKIKAFVERVYQSPDFRHQYWMEVIPLEAILYTLGCGLNYIDNLVANWDHNNSALRRHVYKTALLLGTKLTLYEELGRRMITSIESSHFYTDMGLCILASCGSSNEEKTTWFTRFMGAASMDVELNGHDANLIDKLLKNHHVENSMTSFVQDRLLHSIWLLSSFVQLPVQETLFENEYSGPKSKKKHDLSTILWKRIQEHPGLQPYVSIT